MLLKIHGADNHSYCYTGGKSFNPALPTAVFIHGGQNDHSVWILQTRYFAHHGFGVLAPDLPGHGRSQGPALASIEELAGWLESLLDAAGVTKAILIGHSMGSLVALESAGRAAGSTRIAGIALVGTAYPMKVADALLDAANNDQQSAIDMVNIWSHSTMSPKPSAPGPGFYVQGASQRLMQRIARQSDSKPTVFHTDFAACNNYANGEQAALAVACPTLFLLGQRDVMTPAKAAAGLIAAIKHAKVVQVEASGHALMAEQPDAVLDHLYRFATAALGSPTAVAPAAIGG
ncbi:alpha/beta fold hydrolase [Collimonas fungivorans]|uniref:Alpha/beta hydrolase fold:Thioesterase n=1 Tax=Collimonas fungivorans (strain Ter331) TaxID=1005048 RepID=G0ACE2_COLFT|nr:alpha/beta hydrolase [Collimonas fungivorans]AEK62737.1 Alpha/beta hydrolase fold:Thioesterase [Collimonas fungivorans Ter331]